MHFSSTAVAVVAIQALSATLVSAQNDKTALVPRFALAQASSECDAEEILNTCLKGLQKRADSCEDDDYDCLCGAYESLATCYNNCPDNQARVGNQAQVESYCGAAKGEKPSDSMMSYDMTAKESMTRSKDYEEEEDMKTDMDMDMDTVTETETEMMTDTMTEMMTMTMTDDMEMSATASETGSETGDGAAVLVAAPVSGLLAVVIGILGLF